MPADKKRLIELSMVPQLAAEIAKQINNPPRSSGRLINLGVPPSLAGEIVRQINLGSGNVKKLSELSMAPRLAKELVRQIGSGGGATAPLQVVGLNTSPGDGQVILIWTAPGNGGSPITNYIWQYKISSNPDWITFPHSVSTALTGTITGLTNAQSYDFRVAAINVIGQGPFSSSVTATPNTTATLSPYTVAAPTGPVSSSNTGLLDTGYDANFISSVVAGGRDGRQTWNATDADNLLYVEYGVSGVNAYRRVAGVTSFIGFSSAGSPYGGQTIRCEMRKDGSAVVLMINGGTTTTLFSFSASTLASLGLTRGRFVAYQTTFGGANPSIYYGGLGDKLFVYPPTWDAASKTWSFNIDYTGSTPNELAGYNLSYDGGATSAPLILVSNTTPGTATFRSAPYLGEGDTSMRVIQKFDSAVFQNVTGVVPYPFVLGLNDSGYPYVSRSMGGWKWYLDSPDYDSQFMPYGLAPRKTSDYAASLNGAGNTVLFDQFGNIGANGFGATSYRLTILEGQVYSPSEFGQYTMYLGKNLTFVGFIFATSVTGWTYNSSTGYATFNINGTANNTSHIVINVPSITSQPGEVSPITGLTIPAGRIGPPDIIKTGATGKFLNDYLTTIPQLAKYLRMLDVENANNVLLSNRTRTSSGSRTLATRLRYGATTIEEQTDRCLLTNTGIWSVIRSMDTPEIIQLYADQIIAKLPPSLDPYNAFEDSNERFNFSFTQWGESRIEGARRGYCPVGATPGSLVPETIIDPGFMAEFPAIISQIGNTTSYTALQDIPANTLMAFNLAGVTVVRFVNAILTGATFNAAGDANVVVKYTVDDTERGALRYIADRTKLMAQTVFARFDAAGRTRPAIVLSYQPGNFQPFKTMLEWNGCGDYVTDIADAQYYGNGAGGSLTDYSAVIENWMKSDKDTLYQNGTLAGGVTAATARYFAADRKVIRENADNFMSAIVEPLKAWNIANGKSIRARQYETNQHVDWYNRGDRFPDNGAMNYDAGTSYTAGTFVRGVSGDLAVYEAKAGGVPAGNPPPNATYWTVKVSAAIMAAGSPEETLYRTITNIDPRQGDSVVYHLQQYQNRYGHFHTYYGRTQGTWALQTSENVTTGGTPSLTALKNYFATL